MLVAKTAYKRRDGGGVLVSLDAARSAFLRITHLVPDARKGIYVNRNHRRNKVLSLLLIIPMLCGGCVSTASGPKISHDVWAPILLTPAKYSDYILEDQGLFVGVPGAIAGLITFIPGLIIDFPLLLLSGFFEERGGDETEGLGILMLFYVPCLAGTVVATPFRGVVEVWQGACRLCETGSLSKGQPVQPPVSSGHLKK